MEPITNPSQLPAIGTPETRSLDFKKTYAKGTPASFDGFELGKDVAALANAMGGAILVGAQEAASALHIYLPLDDAEAKATVRAVDDAVKVRCSPSPVVSAEKIAHGSGYIVALNVSPFPGQPVGVWVKGDRADGYGDPCWTFPVRVGAQTKFFRPEQLAMLMSAEYRRIVILLDAVKAGDEVLLTTPNRGRGGEIKCSFESSSALNNLMVLQSNERGGGKFRIPIDRVRSAWQDGSWYVLIEGYFGQAADGKIVFWP